MDPESKKGSGWLDPELEKGLREHLEELRAALTLDERELLALKYPDGDREGGQELTDGEVAKVLGCRREAVTRKLGAIKETLRAEAAARGLLPK